MPPARPEIWVVACEYLAAHTVVSPAGDSVALVSEHPVLWEHTERVESLYVSGTATSPDAVVGALWAAHRERCGGWVPPDRFLNTSQPLADSFRGSGGLVAWSPAPITDAYAAVLRSHGLRPNARSFHEAKHLRGDLRALLIGESYFVGREFSASRL